MNKIKLLLVENDDHYIYILRNSLEMTNNYDIFTASDGSDGLELYKSCTPDIIVADISLPIVSGKEMIKIIREKDIVTPVIFISDSKESYDFIESLNLGGDVYMHKPFIAEELDVQIQALMKRAAINRPIPVLNDDTVMLGKFSYNAANKYLIWNEHRIDLSETETRMLNILAKNKGSIVKRIDVLECLGKKMNFYTSRSMDVFIHKLRGILSRDPNVEIITVRGTGYILKISSP